MSMLLHFVKYHANHIKRGIECLQTARHYEESSPFAGCETMIEWNYDQSEYHFKLAREEIEAARNMAIKCKKMPFSKLCMIEIIGDNRANRAAWAVAGRVLP